MLLIAFLILALVASAIALLFALNTMWNLFRDKVPYVPTPDWAIDWLCQHPPLLFQGGVARSAGVVYDLGCGDGRVLIALKKRFPNIRAIGFEHKWFPYLLARWRTRKTGVEVKMQNFYRANLRNADVVFCFLIHVVMPRVETMLRQQLKQGATVYSYGFTFPTWQPIDRITNPKKPQGSKLNVYRA